MATKSNTYSVAVIGAGRAAGTQGQARGGHQIGYTHTEMYQRNPRVRVEAAADINAENLGVYQKKFNVPRGFSDYREMLAQAKPDIVSVCTYVPLHGRMVEDCARAGVKGIFCEKPFLASPADIVAVRRAVEESGVKLIVGHIRRYGAGFSRARELYLGGAIGDPVLCAAGIEGWDLSEWGSHWLDMFRFFHGDRAVKWVMGQARVRDQRGFAHAMEEHAIAYFQFEDGGKGLLDGGTGLHGGITMTLQGTKGSIRIYGEQKLEIDGPGGPRVEDFSGQPPAGWEKLGIKDCGGWTHLWDMALGELLNWIEGAEEPRIGLSSMLATSELNLAAYLSAIRGDRVDLPLKSDLDEWPVNVLARRRQPDRA